MKTRSLELPQLVIRHLKKKIDISFKNQGFWRSGFLAIHSSILVS